jgi:hypothetical protein
MRYAAADEGREYLAMVSYFRLDGIGAMPRFLWNVLRVGRQLGRSEGLVCYSTGARLGSLEFWSVTVWEDERALMGFVRASPHSEIMEEMRPRVRRSEFVRWEIGGSDVPPDQREAEGLLRRKLAAGDLTA